VTLETAHCNQSDSNVLNKKLFQHGYKKITVMPSTLVEDKNKYNKVCPWSFLYISWGMRTHSEVLL